MRSNVAWSLILALVLALPAYSGSADTNRDGFIEYLLPLATPYIMQGAYGSRWSAEVWIHNASKERMVTPIRGGLVDYSEPRVPPGTSLLWLDWDPASGSALVAFTRDDAARATLSVRLLEHSRRVQPTGVSLPIFGEDDWTTRPKRVIAVPSYDGARTALRVYNPRLLRNAEVRVDLSSTSGEPLATATLPLIVPGRTPNHPGIGAILDLVAAFPILQTVNRYDILLTPVTEGLEFCALVTITDRDTQHVLAMSTAEGP